ncbi:transposase [Thiomicrorhabdus sp. 6S2-11]|uniref:Transposase n=1 Tax=Thiomicrorhabdus marina TaxID=2818442 RepID=A0ABS3Q4L6_9GAMM|nr:transposase [Thiomicrorhabdus marina]MBO1927231.1 transposase [Thiomicrorhabdus marina]
MPRLARVVIPDIPYHVTQRGNRREDVFFDDEDRQFYLELLNEYAQKHQVEIWAYCLMTNHIHLILRPTSKEGLQQVLKPLHMRYAQYINKKMGWKGHLWQGRYFSSALDEAYAYQAIRYVELNPVRAKMVKSAVDYEWSSARAHSGLEESELLARLPTQYQPSQQPDWLSYLNENEDAELIAVIRRNIEKGLPCGNEDFISKLEKATDRALTFKPVGRPKKG